MECAKTRDLHPGKATGKRIKKKSQFREVWRRLQKNKRAMVALAFVALLFLLAIFADVIADYDVECIHQDLTIRFQPPSQEHWLGTDAYGRDVFARIIHGIRVSLVVGLGAAAMSAAIALIFGTVSVYFGGWVDNIITRLVDVVITVPCLLWALAVVAGFGAGISQILFALAAGNVAYYIRVVRSAALSVAGQDYIEVARARGATHLRIIICHIIPNIMGTVLLQFTMLVSINILMCATLSFVGLGVPIPRPEWGSMLSDALNYLRYYPYLVIIPGLALLLTTLALNVFGDCLRDALDPRLKGKA